MRIVFMGTQDFAVPSLEALLKSDDQVVGVVTQPDRPKGRGQEVIPSPIKVVCLREGIPLLQPLKMKDPAFLDALRQWKPDVITVTAFGRILPPAVLTLPPLGCINVHGSLLPKYRGAGVGRDAAPPQGGDADTSAAGPYGGDHGAVAQEGRWSDRLDIDGPGNRESCARPVSLARSLYLRERGTVDPVPGVCRRGIPWGSSRVGDQGRKGQD